MALSRDLILAATTLKRRELHIPELGGTVIVREMTGAERDRYEEIALTLKRTHIRARTAAFALCDDAGKLLFTEADFDALGRLPSSALDAIFEAAREVNALTEADVEALEKNSSTAPSDGSCSGSASPSADPSARLLRP